MRHAAALGLACALAGGPAHAQPFTVEHLLSLQDLGRTAFAPGGRWLVMTVEAPWKEAQRFDLDAMTFVALGRPMVADLTTTAPARPLLPIAPGTTYTTGAFSPDGAKIIVYRFRDFRLDLGVVTLATGEAVWPAVPVDVELGAPVARWLNDETLIVLSRTAETSRSLGRGRVHQVRAQAAWAAQATGAPSGVVLGAGRYQGLTPPPPKADLVRVDLRTGGVQTLAQGAFIDMALSPDHRRLVLIAQGEGLPAGLEAPSLFKASQRRRLVIADLATGTVSTPCPVCDLANLPPAWSPDGRSVLAATRIDKGPPAFSYWRLDIDGQAAALAPDLTTADSPGRDPRVVGGAAWLAGEPVVLARRGGDQRLDWWRLSAQGPVKLTGSLPTAQGPALAADAQGLLLATGAGPVRLTADGVIQTLAPASARLGFPARLAGEPVRAVVITERGRSRTIWPAEGQTWPNATPADDRLLDVQPDHGLVASLSRSARGVKSVVVRDRHGMARTILTLNGDLAQVAAAAPIAITHQDPKGQARTSWLYLPSAAAATHDIPIVVSPYPGSAYPSPPAESTPGEIALSANTQILTSAGYAVLVPSLPIAPDADPGEGLAGAMLAAVDAARIRYPQLSATRLALWGQSYGGWGSLLAATQTDRFKAVIATSPITDLFTFHGLLSPQGLIAPDRYMALPAFYGWSETGQGRMLAPPWKDEDRYRRNSPARLTDKIQAAVMLVTSDSDFTTGQSAPLFSALFRQDKDAVLINYPGEAHVVVSPGNVRDLYQRALWFLADNLAQDAP